MSNTKQATFSTDTYNPRNIYSQSSTSPAGLTPNGSVARPIGTTPYYMDFRGLSVTAPWGNEQFNDLTLPPGINDRPFIPSMSQFSPNPGQSPYHPSRRGFGDNPYTGTGGRKSRKSRKGTRRRRRMQKK